MTTALLTRPASSTTTVPTKMLAQFEKHGIDASSAYVEQTLIVGRGWRPMNGRQVVSEPQLRNLHHKGVTQVTVRAGDKVIDFNITPFV